MEMNAKKLLKIVRLTSRAFLEKLPNSCCKTVLSIIPVSGIRLVKYFGKLVKSVVVSSAKGVTMKVIRVLTMAIITTYIKAIAKDFGILNLSSLDTIGERADIKITATNSKIITSFIM